MYIECIDPRTDPRWNKISTSRYGSVFHSPEWLTALAATYGFDVRALVITRAGEITAALPYCEIRDLRGARIVSLPFSDYCDPLIEDPGYWKEFVDILLEATCPISLRCLHNELPLADDRFSISKQAKWHALDLTRTLQEIWDSLHPSAQRNIRKGVKLGVHIRPAEDVKDLRAFYELHLRVRAQKYRLLAQPFTFFEQIWKCFIETNKGSLMIAEHNGRPIAGTLFLEHADCLYYKFNASDLSLLSIRPNDALIWAGIEYGMSKGCRLLDFGLTDWDQDGLIRYKRKFASSEGTIFMLQSSPHAVLTDQEQQVQQLLPRITNLLTQDSVPARVIEQAGEVLYRYFC